MEKPTVMIMKSSPWKTAHLSKNHPAYAAIFSLIRSYKQKVRFVLVGSSDNPTTAYKIGDDITAWDIQRSGTISHFRYFLQVISVLFRYRPHLTIVLGLQILPVGIFCLFSRRSKYAPVFIGEFNYYGSKISGKILFPLYLKLNSFILRLSQRKISKMFALSRYVLLGMEKSVSSIKGKVRLVFYCVSPVFCPSGETSTEIPETPVILTNAGIEPRKGLDILVRAVSMIPRRLKVIIKGSLRDPTYAAELNKLIRDLKLDDSITLVTKTVNYDTLISFYRSATLFVLPTREDCLGVVLLEALNCNLPVVATSVGGIPDMIENGTNGILVKPDDPYELANAISSLLEDSSKRARIASNARQILYDRFYKDRISFDDALIQSVEGLLDELGLASQTP